MMSSRLFFVIPMIQESSRPGGFWSKWAKNNQLIPPSDKFVVSFKILHETNTRLITFQRSV